jgi:hypothetical protein
MPADREAVEVSLLVALEARVKPKEVRIELRGVRYDKLVDERITGLFSVDPSVDRGEGRAPAVLVKVASVVSLRPGEYQLALGAKHAPSGAAEQFGVKIERPGVQLAPPGKVSLDLLYHFPLPGWPDSSVYPEKLRFTPTPESKFARIAKADLFVGPFKNTQGASTGGTLEASPKTPVAVGEPLLVTVTLKGFPAGLSTGSIEIRGPDLKTPQSMEVEVRARYSSMWVVVLILAGLGLGYLLRIALQQRVELARARSGSVSVVEALESRLKQTPDEVFSSKVKAALAEVRGVLDGRDPKAIDEKAKAANAVLEQATTELQTRLNATHERLKTLRSVVDWDGDLPRELVELLRRSSEVGTRLAEQLAGLDETRARRGLETLERAVTSGVRSAIATWRAALSHKPRDLENLRFVLDKATTEALTAAIARLRGKLDAVTSPGDFAQVAPVLASMRDAGATMRELLISLSESVARDVDAFQSEVASRDGGPHPALTELAKQASELQNQLTAAADYVDLAKPIYEDATRRALMAAFEKVFDDVLAKPAGLLGAIERATFDGARAGQRYFEAVRILPPGATRLKQTTEAVPSAPPPAPERETRGGEVSAAEPAPRLAVESLDTLRARTFRELAVAERNQSAIAAVIISVVGYAIFADKFVGTLTDVVTIFMWGFTLDVSVSKLLEVATPFTGKARS